MWRGPLPESRSDRSESLYKSMALLQNGPVESAIRTFSPSVRAMPSAPMVVVTSGMPCDRAIRFLVLMPVPKRIGERKTRNPFSASSRRSEEHTSELQSPDHLVCRLLLEKKKTIDIY